MKTFRPVIEEKSPINLTFGLALQQIVDLVSFIIRETDLVSFKTGKFSIKIAKLLQDEKNQILTTNVWLSLVKVTTKRKCYRTKTHLKIKTTSEISVALW